MFAAQGDHGILGEAVSLEALINDAIRPHGWWFHDIVEQEDAWWSQRAWLSRTDRGQARHGLRELSWELYLLPKHPTPRLEVGVSANSLRLSFSPGIFSLYLKLGGILSALPMEKVLPGHWVEPSPPEFRPQWEKDAGIFRERWFMAESVTTGIYWFEGTFNWRLWQNEDIWSSKDAWWHRGYWTPMDTLFGPIEFRRRKQPAEVVTFEMDDITYECMMHRETCMWRRPRARKTLKRDSWEISFENGQRPPKFNGKGENAHDCGDNGIFGVGYDVDSIPEAIERYKADVLKNRKRYGTPSDLQGAWR